MVNSDHLDLDAARSENVAPGRRRINWKNSNDGIHDVVLDPCRLRCRLCDARVAVAQAKGASSALSAMRSERVSVERSPSSKARRAFQECAKARPRRRVVAEFAHGSCKAAI